MSTPVRVHRTHVPCATSTPVRLLGLAGGGASVYSFAALVSDCLRFVSRLDKHKSAGVSRCVWSVAAVALGSAKRAQRHR